jgi:hypothetical protein
MRYSHLAPGAAARAVQLLDAKGKTTGTKTGTSTATEEKS